MTWVAPVLSWEPSSVLACSICATTGSALGISAWVRTTERVRILVSASSSASSPVPVCPALIALLADIRSCCTLASSGTLGAGGVEAMVEVVSPGVILLALGESG